MMTQEEFMDVKAMKRQGLTLIEIAEVTGYHPRTIGNWLAQNGPPQARHISAPPTIDEAWSARIAELLRPAPKLLATSIYEIIKTEGFIGSYPSVARHLNGLRGPRFRAATNASIRIETAPGEESQFDWSDASGFTVDWGLGEVECFSNILSWSRFPYWWFAASEDRQHTFEGLVRSYEAFGGVPAVSRTDRMGALGSSQGRRFKLHAPAAAFFSYYGVELRACAPGDAKRKGKVERPFREMKESFLTECCAQGPPTSIDELNDRATKWLAARVHNRIHRTTGVTPAERFKAETQILGRLPRTRFDTAYIEPRRVHVAVPTIEWRGVRYSVPPSCLGQRVEVRQEVGSDSIQVKWAGQVVISHRIATGDVKEVWDAGHWREAQDAALGRTRGRHLQLVIPSEPPATAPISLDIAGDVEVDPVDLSTYGGNFEVNP